MRNITNRKAKNYVRNFQDFTANNIFAISQGKWYVVYSYGRHFPMYAYNVQEMKWYGNSDKYSVTTSRHQNQTRPYAEHIEYRTTPELINLINS